MGNRIYVGNLSYDSTEDDVIGAFGAYGAVREVRIVKDRDTGRPRGFAFVEMQNADDAQNAIRGMNGAQLGGRPLKVNEATERNGQGGGRPPGDRRHGW